MAPHAGSVPVRRFTISPALALLLSLLSAGTASAQKMPTLGPQVGRAVGDLPIDFTLKDLEGNPHSLKGLRQEKKVVLVVFWASWCVPCLQEVPVVREAYAKYHDRGLEVLGIAVDISQTREGARTLARQMKMDYPILWDDGGSVMDRYRIASIPQNFLIGRDGIIRYAGTSLPPAHDALIESLLAAPHVDGASSAH